MPLRRVQFNQDGLLLNGTHQLLTYADDKETGLEVNADKNVEWVVQVTEGTKIYLLNL